MKIGNRRTPGFTLVEIMIVVAIIGLLAAIAIPNYVKARTNAQRNSCISNLREIEGATQIWALEQKAASTAVVQYSDISSYLKRAVNCPAAGTDTSFSGSYSINGVTDAPTCNISGSDPVAPHLLPDTTQ
ncbi:MAG TPA: prepilin-type N-terminal cleavage/methylation domain-containing protein [Verrucomicrobiae bacterium]|nr:prepilin-type N-terminal cleavage/methylation domain-containing protein [Verrucomicrobiae bacterium]